MSFLGLHAPPPREENLFKRIFWPADQPYEADSLGQQGMWVCLLVAAISAVVSVYTGHPLIGLLLLLFYGLGGMGVREHSVAAAVIVAVGYLASAGMVMLLGRPPGVLDIAIAGLLLANIRGTRIAAKWKRRAFTESDLGSEGEMFPARLNTTFGDKLIDQWPARFWPRGRFVFFAVAAIYGVLFLIGVVGTLRMKTTQRPAPEEIQLQVTPDNR